MTQSDCNLRILTQHATLPAYLQRYAAMAEQQGWNVAVQHAPAGAEPQADAHLKPVPRACAGRIRHPLAIYTWHEYFDTFEPFLQEAEEVSAEIFVAGDLPSLPVAAWCAERHGGYLVYAIDELAADAPERSTGEAASWTRMEQYLLTFCDAVWTCSEALSHAVAERYALPKPRLSYPHTILPVPPPAAGNNTLIHEVLNLPEAMVPEAIFTVVVPGPLEAMRGLEMIVEALPHLPSDIVVVFAGEGPMQRALRDQATTLGVSERVRIWPEATPEGITGADLALVPDPAVTMADWLRVPEALLWARQAGVPVIAQDTAGINTVLSMETAGMPATMDAPSTIAHVLAFAYQADRSGWQAQAQQHNNSYSWTAQAEILQQGLERLRATFPKSAYRQVLEAAYVDLDARDAESAEEKLRACLDLDPTHPDALALATTLSLANFDLKQAQHYQVQTLSQDPQHVLAQRRGRQIHTITRNLKLILSTD